MEIFFGNDVLFNQTIMIQLNSVHYLLVISFILLLPSPVQATPVYIIAEEEVKEVHSDQIEVKKLSKKQRKQWKRVKESEKGNGEKLATASFILGVLGVGGLFVLPAIFLSFLGGLLGIIFSIVALVRFHKAGGKQPFRKWAVLGLVTSIIAFGIPASVFIYLIFFAL